MKQDSDDLDALNNTRLVFFTRLEQAVTNLVYAVLIVGGGLFFLQLAGFLAEKPLYTIFIQASLAIGFIFVVGQRLLIRAINKELALVGKNSPGKDRRSRS